MRAVFYGILLLATPALLAQEKPPRMVEIEARLVRATDAQLNKALNAGVESASPNSLALAEPPSGVMALRGVFTAEQSKGAMNKLEEAGAEIISIPRAITLSGHRAMLENVRELRYPSKLSTPSKDAQTVIPIAFETKKVGIMLEVQPTLGPDNYTIEIFYSPRIVDFLGFIDYSEAKPGATPPGPDANLDMLKAPLKGGGIWQPVFSTREITSTVSVYAGQTILITESGKSPRLCLFLTVRLVPEK